MTKLLVSPIDPDAPGSFKKRRRVLEALQAAKEGFSSGDTLTAYLTVEDMIL